MGWKLFCCWLISFVLVSFSFFKERNPVRSLWCTVWQVREGCTHPWRRTCVYILECPKIDYWTRCCIPLITQGRCVYAVMAAKRDKRAEADWNSSHESQNICLPDVDGTILKIFFLIFYSPRRAGGKLLSPPREAQVGASPFFSFIINSFSFVATRKAEKIPCRSFLSDWRERLLAHVTSFVQVLKNLVLSAHSTQYTPHSYKTTTRQEKAMFSLRERCTLMCKMIAIGGKPTSIHLPLSLLLVVCVCVLSCLRLTICKWEGLPSAHYNNLTPSRKRKRSWPTFNHNRRTTEGNKITK